MTVTRREMIKTGVLSLMTVGLSSCGDDPIAPSKTNTTITQTGSQTVEVSMTQLAQAIQTQQCEQWCWAACISMLFNFYGHPLSQAEIVAATYGSVVCLPAGTSTTIGVDLSRTYIDQRGVAFRSRVVAAYDFMNGINAISNTMIIDALNNSNPLLYCNTHHAMVVYSVTYTPTALGPNVQSVRVIDPWPFSPRSHELSLTEMVARHLGGEMTFLAEVQVA